MLPDPSNRGTIKPVPEKCAVGQLNGAYETRGFFDQYMTDSNREKSCTWCYHLMSWQSGSVRAYSGHILMNRRLGQAFSLDWLLLEDLSQGG